MIIKLIKQQTRKVTPMTTLNPVKASNKKAPIKQMLHLMLCAFIIFNILSVAFGRLYYIKCSAHGCQLGILKIQIAEWYHQSWIVPLLRFKQLNLVMKHHNWCRYSLSESLQFRNAITTRCFVTLYEVWMMASVVVQSLTVQTPQFVLIVLGHWCF